MASAVASFGSHVCFCASVPPLTRARVRISGRVMSDPPTPSDPRERFFDQSTACGLSGRQALGQVLNRAHDAS